MTLVLVQIGDFQVAHKPGDQLVTYGLGSCIGVSLYDPGLQVAGLLHFMLPSRLPGDTSSADVGRYADTGIPALFEAMYRRGCRKSNLVVCVAGGAHTPDVLSAFNIGKRNYVILRKLFWKNGVVIAAEDVGGEQPRTMKVDVSTGEVRLKRTDGEFQLWPGVEAQAVGEQG